MFGAGRWLYADVGGGVAFTHKLFVHNLEVLVELGVLQPGLGVKGASPPPRRLVLQLWPFLVKNDITMATCPGQIQAGLLQGSLSGADNLEITMGAECLSLRCGRLSQGSLMSFLFCSSSVGFSGFPGPIQGAGIIFTLLTRAVGSRISSRF